MKGGIIMENLKDKLYSHLTIVEHQLDFKSVTGQTLIEWFNPLLESFTDDGAISYLLEQKDRYRASPLSSTIEWLANADLLTVDCLDILQNKLIFLRDNNQQNDANIGNKEKQPGDELGWSLSEGVSVWSTSTALLALFDKYNNWKKHTDIIKETTIWLVKQKKTNSAWAYQLDNNCETNIIMTALAIRAICKLAMNKTSFLLSKEDVVMISEALNHGFNYISKTANKRKKYVYWSFDKKENCAATIWAMLAIKDLLKVKEFNLNLDEINSFYNTHIDGSIRFVLNKLPKKPERWSDEQLVLEGGAKYNKQKNYQSLSATLIPHLFELGVSPYHPKIVNQIKWIINNPTDWKIKAYDRGNICSFSYAMILSTIAIWINRVGSINAQALVDNAKSKINRLQRFVFGYYSQKNSPYRLVLKTRISLFVFIIVLLFFIFLCGPALWNIIYCFVKWIFSLIFQKVDDIVVGIVTNVIWLGGGAILTLIIKKRK